MKPVYRTIEIERNINGFTIRLYTPNWHTQESKYCFRTQEEVIAFFKFAESAETLADIMNYSEKFEPNHTKE